VKPFAEACTRNQDPILAELHELFASTRCVLEIGSGTGQHAVYFGERLPHLIWQTSDLPENHASIMAWVSEADLPNVKPPLHLDVSAADWPVKHADAVFSANTIHIISWPAVEHMFAGVGNLLSSDGLFCTYGPYIYHGEHTSESNVRFDAWLKDRDPESGVREIADLERVAGETGLTLHDDREMPANNRLLVWRKR
jgi:cyclopropane fatty-acyl-phospholipid synthase-like methyltransferase